MKKSALMFLTAFACLSLFFTSCKKESLVNPAQEELASTGKKPGGGTTSSGPTVSFASPVNGSTVTGTIVVKLNATSTVGIRSTGLMLTVNGFNCIFGNDTVAPYEFTWNTNAVCLKAVLPGQQVTLRGSATDNNGVVRYTDIVVTKQ